MSYNTTSFQPTAGNLACIERPLEPLLFGVPDKYMVAILPVVVYWALSLIFHFLDEGGYLSQYKIHTPEEFLKRNRVTVREVIREVLIQHFLQTAVAFTLAWYESEAMTGCESQEVVAWAAWISNSIKRSLPFLSIVGVDSSQLPQHFNYYLSVPASTNQVAAEPLLWAAKALYYVVIPVFQFLLAAFMVDTWQYFLHRAMHENRWLYRTFHIRHHRLYVPYAFGALYNHPLEGFLLDSVGSAIAYKISGMNFRQGIWFFTATTIKTVDDHSGYQFPFNPLHLITDNNAYYHDIHHQSWGIKANFSQPFTSFWDRLLGTAWNEPQEATDVRYERGKANAMPVAKKEQ